MEMHLTDTQRDELQIFQRNVEKRSEYVKVTTILLLDKGLSIVDISDYLGIDSSTIYCYINSYISDGLVSYLKTDYQGYWVGPPNRSFIFSSNISITERN